MRKAFLTLLLLNSAFLGPTFPVMAEEAPLAQKIQKDLDLVRSSYVSVRLGVAANHAALAQEFLAANSGDPELKRSWTAYEAACGSYQQFSSQFLTLKADPFVAQILRLNAQFGIPASDGGLLVAKYQELRASMQGAGVAWKEGRFIKPDGKIFGAADWDAAAKRGAQLSDKSRAELESKNQALFEIQKLAQDKQYDQAVQKLDQLLGGLAQRPELLEKGLGSAPLQTTLALIQKTQDMLPQSYRGRVQERLNGVDVQLQALASKKVAVPLPEKEEAAAAAGLAAKSELSFYTALSALPATSGWAKEQFFRLNTAEILRQDKNVAGSPDFLDHDPEGAPRVGVSVTYKDNSTRYESMDGLYSIATSADSRTVTTQDKAAGTYRKTLDGKEVFAWRQDRGTGKIHGKFQGTDFEAAWGEMMTFSSDEQIMFVAKGLDAQGKPILDRWYGFRERGVFLPGNLGTVRYTWKEKGNHTEVTLDHGAVKRIMSGEKIDLSAIPAGVVSPAYLERYIGWFRELPQLGKLYENSLFERTTSSSHDDPGQKQSNWVDSLKIVDGRMEVSLGQKSTGAGNIVDHLVAAVEPEGGKAPLKVYEFVGNSTFMWQFDEDGNSCQHFTLNAEASQEGKTAFDANAWYDKVNGRWVKKASIPYEMRGWAGGFWGADTWKTAGMAGLQSVGEGAGALFSPFQLALNEVLADTWEKGGAIGNLFSPDHDASAFAQVTAVYTRRQAKINEWLGYGANLAEKNEEKRDRHIMEAFAEARSRLNENTGRDFNNFLNGEIDAMRRKNLGELYKFHQDDAITDKDRAYMAAQTFGLANMPAEYFKQGRDEFGRGHEVWGGIKYLAGGFIVGGEAYVSGVGFGMAANAIKFAAVGSRLGLTAEEVAAAVKASAQGAKLEGVAGEAARAIKIINRAEMALMTAPTAVQAIGDIPVVLRGLGQKKDDQWWAHADSLISNAAGFMGIGIGIGQSMIEGTVKAYQARVQTKALLAELNGAPRAYRQRLLADQAPKVDINAVRANEGNDLVLEGRIKGEDVVVETAKAPSSADIAAFGQERAWTKVVDRVQERVTKSKLLNSVLGPLGMAPEVYGEVDIGGNGNPSYAAQNVAGKTLGELTHAQAKRWITPETVRQAFEGKRRLAESGLEGKDAPEILVLTKDQTVSGVAKKAGDVVFVDSRGRSDPARGQTPEQLAREMVFRHLWADEALAKDPAHPERVKPSEGLGDRAADSASQLLPSLKLNRSWSFPFTKSEWVELDFRDKPPKALELYREFMKEIGIRAPEPNGGLLDVELPAGDIRRLAKRLRRFGVEPTASDEAALERKASLWSIDPAEVENMLDSFGAEPRGSAESGAEDDRIKAWEDGSRQVTSRTTLSSNDEISSDRQQALSTAENKRMQKAIRNAEKSGKLASVSWQGEQGNEGNCVSHALANLSNGRFTLEEVMKTARDLGIDPNNGLNDGQVNSIIHQLEVISEREGRPIKFKYVPTEEFFQWAETRAAEGKSRPAGLAAVRTEADAQGDPTSHAVVVRGQLWSDSLNPKDSAARAVHVIVTDSHKDTSLAYTGEQFSHALLSEGILILDAPAAPRSGLAARAIDGVSGLGQRLRRYVQEKQSDGQARARSLVDFFRRVGRVPQAESPALPEAQEAADGKFLPPPEYAGHIDAGANQDFMRTMSGAIDAATRDLAAELQSGKTLTAADLRAMMDRVAESRHQAARAAKDSNWRNYGNAIPEDAAHLAEFYAKGDGRPIEDHAEGLERKELLALQDHAVWDNIAQTGRHSSQHDSALKDLQAQRFPQVEIDGHTYTLSIVVGAGDGVLQVQHPDFQTMIPLRAKAFEILAKAVSDPNISEAALLDSLAESYFLLMHATPYVRGSPAIVESFYDAVLRAKLGKTLPPKIREPFWDAMFWDTKKGPYTAKQFLSNFDLEPVRAKSGSGSSSQASRALIYNRKTGQFAETVDPLEAEHPGHLILLRVDNKSNVQFLRGNSKDVRFREIFQKAVEFAAKIQDEGAGPQGKESRTLSYDKTTGSFAETSDPKDVELAGDLVLLRLYDNGRVEHVRGPLGGAKFGDLVRKTLDFAANVDKKAPAPETRKPISSEGRLLTYSQGRFRETVAQDKEDPALVRLLVKDDGTVDYRGGDLRGFREAVPKARDLAVNPGGLETALPPQSRDQPFSSPQEIDAMLEASDKANFRKGKMDVGGQRGGELLPDSRSSWDGDSANQLTPKHRIAQGRQQALKTALHLSTQEAIKAEAQGKLAPASWQGLQGPEGNCVSHALANMSNGRFSLAEVVKAAKKNGLDPNQGLDLLELRAVMKTLQTDSSLRGEPVDFKTYAVEQFFQMAERRAAEGRGRPAGLAAIRDGIGTHTVVVRGQIWIDVHNSKGEVVGREPRIVITDSLSNTPLAYTPEQFSEALVSNGIVIIDDASAPRPKPAQSEPVPSIWRRIKGNFAGWLAAEPEKPEAAEAKARSGAVPDFMARLEPETRKIADKVLKTDDMTGLPNNRYLNEHAADILGLAEDPAVAFMDMNNFGAINDALVARRGGLSQGRMEADGILSIAGARLGRLAGESGVTVGRHGGEEFVVLGERADVLKFIQKARGEFAGGQILRDARLNPGDYKAIDAALQAKSRAGQSAGDFTTGIAGAKGRSFDAAREAADAALLEAKANGQRGGGMVEQADGRLKPLAGSALPGTEPRPPPENKRIPLGQRLEALRLQMSQHDFAAFLEQRFKDVRTNTRTPDYLEYKAPEWNAQYAAGGEMAILSARGLKLINDTPSLGHSAGDRYLQGLGQTLRAEVNRARNKGLDVQEPIRIGAKDFVLVGKDASAVASTVADVMKAKMEAGQILALDEMAKVRAYAASLRQAAPSEVGNVGLLRMVSSELAKAGDGSADVRATLDGTLAQLEAAKGTATGGEPAHAASASIGSSFEVPEGKWDYFFGRVKARIAEGMAEEKKKKEISNGKRSQQNARVLAENGIRDTPEGRERLQQIMREALSSPEVRRIKSEYGVSVIKSAELPTATLEFSFYYAKGADGSVDFSQRPKVTTILPKEHPR